MSVRCHHILLVSPLINVYGPLLYSALLESLSLLFESLGVLLISLDQLDFFLRAFVALLVLLILQRDLFMG